MGVSRVKDVEKEKEKEEEEKKKKEKPKEIKVKKEERKIGGIVRILNTDLDANKNLLYGLTGIKGVSYTFSKAVIAALGLDAYRKLSTLTPEEIEKIEDCLKNPAKYNIPSFLFNRRRDPETGLDIHLVGPDVDIFRSMDIKREIELKTYKGFRHMYGQPVRGQRTRSHFRHGRTVGVLRGKMKQLAQQQAKEKKEEKK
ncbi:MAG: 30S ribosomal protein S13 [Candidatus Aenigmarchaeota archaeon]|jgi:small subunit ribosomal protein S13|nr:30S ribosomal protein S13 [Candidatus Aenigmarchaeota archaeon]